jgi:hypothetical protein
MKRNALNFVIDLSTALMMAGMIATGLLVRFVLPPGSGSTRFVWGLGRHDWGDVHFWLAVAAGAVVLVHVAMHWQWVCVTARRLLPARGGRLAPPPPPAPLARNAAGAALVVLLAALFGGFVWTAKRAVEVREQDGRAAAGVDGAGVGHRGDEAGEEGGPGFIRGSMTLSEVARARGLSVDAVRARLGLPAGTPDDERLGRLSKKYRFTMEEARRRVAAPETGK